MKLLGLTLQIRNQNLWHRLGIFNSSDFLKFEKSIISNKVISKGFEGGYGNMS